MATFEGDILNDPSAKSSPGLAYLSEFLPVLDSLDVNVVKTMPENFLSPDAVFILSPHGPTPASEVISKFEMRANLLSKFSHTESPIRAWDHEKSGKPGARTVLYESISRYISSSTCTVVELTIT